MAGNENSGNRPRDPSGRMQRYVFRMPPGLQLAILRSCLRSKKTASQFIREAIVEKLEREKKSAITPSPEAVVE